ncbi:5269_t:CDS:1 [Scutellospora calospora]|uniref:5269_t:CDS:1 n=1 Tax=Scutellospora calospora TaxID=85575 RepID=A0ACA9KLH4_9GLOM|nr:5269_t:CDS:1 [Scutellospora calospora]
MANSKLIASVIDYGQDQEISIDSQPEDIYCDNCDKARLNGESLNRVKSSTDTLVKIPFPPTILAEDLVKHLLKSKSQSPKMLNEFFIYRKVFVQELKKQNVKVKMTRASKLASASWYQESSIVKNEYRRLARKVENLFIIARNEKLQSQANEKK